MKIITVEVTWQHVGDDDGSEKLNATFRRTGTIDDDANPIEETGALCGKCVAALSTQDPAAAVHAARMIAKKEAAQHGS